jgi:hypothetical protein
MMLWKEIKSWAKKHGYASSKNDNSYSWYKISSPNIGGEVKSVSKLSKAIFNDITGDKWKEHQENYGIS